VYSAQNFDGSACFVSCVDDNYSTRIVGIWQEVDVVVVLLGEWFLAEVHRRNLMIFLGIHQERRI